jgi:hypothetical protein
MALILVLFAVISLRDIWAFLKSGKQNVWLKLSDERSERIRKFLRINLRLPHYLGAAAVSGIFVSLTELACTGQVYLPTIMFILQVPALKQRAMLFLCLYNLAFILPLVVVFLMALTGVQAIKFNQISRKDFIIGKILLAVFFLIFAVFLWGR